LYRKDRDRHRGGVGVYVKQTIPAQRRHDLEQADVEVCCVDIKPNKARKTLLACIYRPPNAGSEWRDSAEGLVHKLNATAEEENADVIIMGDFNSDLLKSTQALSSVEFLMGLYQLVPIILQPTRITESTESCIDNMFVTNPDRFRSSASVAWGPSDHNLILACAQAGREACGTRWCEYRSYKQYTQQSFIDGLKSVHWDTVLDCTDVTDAWDAFKDIFLNVADKFAPLCKRRVRDNNTVAPWMTDRVKNMMGRRDAARRKAIKTKEGKDWEVYRVIRNQTTSAVRKAKKIHFAEAVTEAKGDQSLMWKIINAFTGKSKGKCQVQNLARPDGTNISDPSEMSQEFNSYFATCATSLADSMPTSQKDPLRHIPEPSTEFSFESVDESTVLSELLRLKAKKATGLDNIPSKLLKDSAPVIVRPLTHIFNLSLATGEVPSDWKTAKITPIYKSGNRTNVANYRPVSVLSVTSKVLEKLVGNQVSRYMAQNNLLTVYQSGFRRNHSTASAVLKIVEDIRSAINSRQVTVALFLDLRKAFDTVNHAILLSKLKKLGFDRDATKWFTSYLSGRSQCTSLQSQCSEMAAVTCGVPQGSVLGPLLFCLYVNDMPQVLEKCKIHLYADDTAIYYSAGTMKECEEAVSQDMKRVSDWLIDNRLSLHHDKTKSMLFGVPQKLRHVGTTVQITDGVNIYEQVNTFKYLGITLDPSLQWSAHITNITKKIFSGLSAMRRAKPYVTKEILHTMCQTLLLSHLDYCGAAWLPSLVQGKKTQMLQLDRLLFRAARMITGYTLRDHVPVGKLLAEAGLVSVRNRAEKISLATVFNAVRGKAPLYISDMFRWKSPPTIRARTRTAVKMFADWDPHQLNCPVASLKCYEGSLKSFGPQLWNKLSLKHRKTLGLVKFIKEL